MRWKAFWLLFRYNARSTRRFLVDYLPIWTFPLLVWLFFMMGRQGRDCRRAQGAAKETSTRAVWITVEGKVFRRSTRESPTHAFTVQPKAVVETAGYRDTADSGGRYRLRFPSGSREDVPLIITADTIETVLRVSIPVGTATLHQDLIVP
jgi:hypothetical protein